MTVPATGLSTGMRHDYCRGMDIGRILIVIGLFLVVLGALVLCMPKAINPIHWFGRLPGDIHYSTERTEVYIPLVSMLLLSVCVSVVSWLIRRFFTGV